MLNKVYLTGNVGHDPDIKMTREGREVATFFLATNLTWKDVDGNARKKTEWHRVIVFREDLVAWVKKRLKRGDYVLIEGRLSYWKRESKSEQSRYIPNIVIFEREGQIVYIRSGKLKPAPFGPETNENTHSKNIPNSPFLKMEAPKKETENKKGPEKKQEEQEGRETQKGIAKETKEEKERNPDKAQVLSSIQSHKEMTFFQHPPQQEETI